MPQVSFGSTQFVTPDTWDEGAKVKISTAEGSVIAVPAADLLRMVYGCFVLPQRQLKAEMKDWREGLLG